MPNIFETAPKDRKIIPIIYALDCSGSMKGAPIAAVNSAMRDTVDVMKDVAADNPTAEIWIGVLQFSTSAKWVTNGLVHLDHYFWNDIEAGGLTDYGSALKELDHKMSRAQFFNSPIGYMAPVIIWMSDGEPSDDYKGALELISTNKWFQASNKVAIAVGDDVKTETLANITGSREAVIKVEELEELKKLIRVVSVTASMVGSQSRTDGDMIEDTVRSVARQMNQDEKQAVSVDLEPGTANNDKPDLVQQPASVDTSNPFNTEMWND